MVEPTNKKINFLIFFFSMIFFILKWHHSFLNFDESINVRIIFESVSDGYYYFPSFKALTNFDLNNSFDPSIKNLSNITITTGAFFLHFIFYLIFSEWSFVILEFLFIIFFLIIFYKISRLLEFGRIQSLALAVVLFNLPNFIEIINLGRSEYFSVIISNFYSFRFPRPLVTNIIFFLFILLSLRINQNRILSQKNSLIVGAISGLSFSSHLHFFVLEQLFIIFSLLYIFKIQIIKNLKNNIKFIFFYIFSFVVISSPTLINLFYAEIDHLERMGLTSLNYDQKIFILKYLFSKLFKIEFLLTFLISILFFLLIKFNKKYFIFRKLNPFFILFYLSIISPFIFITFSPSFFSHAYIFNNIIVICAFLLFFFAICIYINCFFKKNSFFKLSNYIATIVLLISLFVNYYQTNKNYNNNHLNNDNFIERKEFNTIVKIIEKNNLLKEKNITLLTFDNKFLVWSILNNIKYLNIINGTFTSKKHEMLENDLINTFKYLKLNKEDFKKFIKNEKISSWRYRNENIKNLFWMRYQANSMITFNDSKNFDNEIIEFIKDSSPLLSQQLIIPNEEMKRFLNKYDSKINSSFSKPQIIIINKNNPILAKSNINLINFCKSFKGKFYDFYYSLKLKEECIK